MLKLGTRAMQVCAGSPGPRAMGAAPAAERPLGSAGRTPPSAPAFWRPPPSLAVAGGPREKSPKFPQFGVRPPGGARGTHWPRPSIDLSTVIHLVVHEGKRWTPERENVHLVSVGRSCWKRRGGDGGPGRPKFSLTVPHRDTLAVLVLSTLRPRFAIPLGGLREGCECATGSRVGPFRSYRSVLRGRAVKAHLGQSRAQKAFREADLGYVVRGVVPKRTSPPWHLWDLGPLNGWGKCGPRFPLRFPIEIRWPCSSYPLCVPDLRFRQGGFVRRGRGLQGHGWARFDHSARCYATVRRKPT
ncbi:hypothetical protein XENOCAPTIV_020982 [Xenoophorus captivus]|uniref:Uncharacterized protein n=1 Tax=Xenoophorus captivus TaxID=1517983 RepID=A0ABV0SHM3_9TELE